jgi:hypothetical protein
MKALIAQAIAVSAAIALAAPAHCAPELGTACSSRVLNKTATSRGGQTVRCLVDQTGFYMWVIDTGKTQDPWIAGQTAWAACTKIYTAANCRDILDGPYDMSP